MRENASGDDGGDDDAARRKRSGNSNSSTQLVQGAVGDSPVAAGNVPASEDGSSAEKGGKRIGPLKVAAVVVECSCWSTVVEGQVVCIAALGDTEVVAWAGGTVAGVELGFAGSGVVVGKDGRLCKAEVRCQSLMEVVEGSSNYLGSMTVLPYW